MSRLSCIKSAPVSELEVVAVVHVGHDHRMGTLAEREAWNQDLASKAEWQDFIGRCDCCGSTRLQYACEVVHKPTMTGYFLGRTCAYKIEGLCHGSHIENISVALAEKAQVRRRLGKFRDANPAHADILDWAGREGAHHIARDIYSKIGRYGDVSEKQIDLLYRLKDQEAKRAAEKANEPKPTAPAPEGRVEVTGEVLTVKDQEGPFGKVWKMLVRITEGPSAHCKVWCTAPGATVRGETIKFRATFTRSDKDQFFAFGSRPKLVA